MFENWMNNFKNRSNSLKDRISSGTLTSRTSETLTSLKSVFKEKSTSLASYFNETKSTANNRFSGLNGNCPHVDNTAINDDDIDYYDEESEQDVIDRFISIISLDYNDDPRRNDREEIRRRLATGSDNDEYFNASDKPGKKPSLQARLQSGMNLQICFMNETSSDTDSPSSESAPPSRSGTPSATPSPPKSNGHPEPPKSLNLSSKVRESKSTFTPCGANEDFFTRQARLQAEARLALSQARDRARLQMEADRLSGKTSPITEMLRASLKKVGVHFPPERRRVSRQMLTDMNVAQLQVLVNDLHTQIENLNEGLVKFLMERDELHMTQDSTLVDIEDVTRYLGAKESSLLKDDIARNNNLAPPVSSSKPVITRIVSLGGAKK